MVERRRVRSLVPLLLLAAILIACRTAVPAEESTMAHPPPGPAGDERFAAFRAAVSKHFKPVAEEFGLRTVAERTFYRETHIEFRGPAGKLTISHELESGTWVAVAVPTASGHERGFGLHTVVEAQTRSAGTFLERTRRDDLNAEVRALADLTREHAGSVLRERAANLRELHLLMEKAIRKRERTEMGYDRALDPRPALAELFAACQPGQQVICAYAAVVDDNYSTADVAAFLKVPEGDVQRMLREHDTIR